MPINKKYHPDYRALYPGADISDEVLKALRESDRKIEYMEYELKHSRVRRDSNGEIKSTTPPRESSLELLIERDKQFAVNSRSIEDGLLDQETHERLHHCIDVLMQDERALIDALFYQGVSDAAYAKEIGMSQTGLSKKKRRILGKLLKLMVK